LSDDLTDINFSSVNVEEISSTIKSLAATIKIGNPDDICLFIEKLKSQLEPSIIAKLIDQVNEYDYDNALSTLDKIAERIGVVIT